MLATYCLVLRGDGEGICALVFRDDCNDPSLGVVGNDWKGGDKGICERFLVLGLSGLGPQDRRASLDEGDGGGIIVRDQDRETPGRSPWKGGSLWVLEDDD